PFRVAYLSGVNTMPSDAYMELSDPDTWGETYDEQFQGRSWGAFQIASFEFGVTSNREDSDDSDPKAGKAASGVAAAVQAHPTVREFTVKKWIDKSSTDLFMLCCQQKKSSCARVFVREKGDHSKQPWMWLEFTGVYVDHFDWI